MQQSCSHCDDPDISLLRLRLISEILRAEATVLVLLADVWQESGLLAQSAATMESLTQVGLPSPGETPQTESAMLDLFKHGTRPE